MRTQVRQQVRSAMAHGEVRFIDYRGDGARGRLIVTERTSDAAYDTAANVARGAALALGIGCAVTEQPGAMFELWHNGEHIADVMSA